MSALPAASADLTRRRWVWDALSALFVDNAITDESLRYAARISAECGYADDELSDIYRKELAPALAFNLFDIAGVWGAFDLDWLQSRILRPRRLVDAIEHFIVAPFAVWLLRDEWRRFREILVEERERVRQNREQIGCEWQPCYTKEIN